MASPQTELPSTPTANPASGANESQPAQPHPPGSRTGHGSQSALEQLQQDIRGKSTGVIGRQDH